MSVPGSCGHCGAPLMPERILRRSHYCSPEHARYASKARARARARGDEAPATAGMCGPGSAGNCKGMCEHPDAVARLHVAAIVRGTSIGAQRSYADGWRRCRRCVIYVLAPERRFCPCCLNPMQKEPVKGRHKWRAKHPECAPPEVS